MFKTVRDYSFSILVPFRKLLWIFSFLFKLHISTFSSIYIISSGENLKYLEIFSPYIRYPLHIHIIAGSETLSLGNKYPFEKMNFHSEHCKHHLTESNQILRIVGNCISVCIYVFTKFTLNYRIEACMRILLIFMYNIWSIDAVWPLGVSPYV